MKRMYFLCSITIFSWSFLSAALPPLYTSVSQIQGLLSDPQLAALLGASEPLESIVRTEEGFVITTAHSKLLVVVTAKAQQMPGPISFEYSFGQIQPR